MYHYYIGPDVFNLSGALVSWDRTKELSDINVPALIMSGEFDYGSRNDFDQLVRAIPQATGWYEPGVSHFPMYEAPDSFSNALLAFLRNNL
jgi:pimeloyl-ACP methyl ester carboxylesterase